MSSIGASPSSLQFSTVFGSTPTSQAITLSGTSSFTAAASSAAGWLTVGPTTGISPTTLIVSLNNAVVPTLSPGTYSGTISITPAASPTLTIAVTLTVTPTPPVTVGPASLNLGYQIGGTNNAASQNLTVSTTAGQPLAFTVSSTVNPNPAGTNWITVTPASVAGATGSAQVAIAYNTAITLPVGTYTGNVQISAPGFTPATTNIPVTLVVSSFPLLIVPTAPLSFTYELSGAAPPSQTVTATATTGTIPFTVGETYATNNGSWIVVTSPAAGFLQDGTPFSVSVNPAGLAPGTYSGTITVTPGAGAGNGAQQIPVTLTVANDPLIVANGCTAASATCSLSFAYQVGQAAPAAQNLNLASSTGATLNYTATATTTSCGSWLGLTGSPGVTNGVVTVSVLNPTSLTAGTCSGTISIAGTNPATGAAAPNSPLTIPVTLFVSATPLLLVSPGSVTLTVPVNGQATQPVSLTSTSSASQLSYTVTFTTASGGPWLSLNQLSGSTPSSSLQITAAPGPILSAGTYSGSVTVTATGPGGAAVANSPLTIPVTLQVTAGSLSVTPATLSFSQLAGAPASAAQSVQVSSNGQPLTYTVVPSTNSPVNWLFVSPSSGTTNGSFSVGTDGSKLTAGTYTGVVTVTAAGPNGSPVSGSPATVQVTLVVTSGTVSAAPTSLTFTQAAGGSAPAAQPVTLSGTPGPVNFTVSATTASGGSWLTPTPASGTTPATIQVSASAGSLAIGQYTGTVTITAPGATGSPISIPVTLNVTSGQAITATPATLAFNYVVGTAVPAAQQVQAVTTGSSISLSAAASTKDGANWLSVTPASGNTPATLSVAVSPQTLTAGTYTGSITITSSSATQAIVPVTLTVVTIPQPVIVAVKNAASYVSGGVSPGELVLVGGTGVGPATVVFGQLTAQGTLATTAGGVQVMFDGTPAPVYYALANQTAVFVPYEVAGRPTTSITVVYQGVVSAPLVYNVVAAVPGIFTQNQQGSGPGSILNQDNSINGPNSGAAKSSYVAVYMTGEGQTSPSGVTGAVTPVNGSGLKKPVLAVAATVGGLPATIAYAGSAPGDVNGVMQVNLQIPANAVSGPQPVVITFSSPGSATLSTQAGVTVQVQ